MLTSLKNITERAQKCDFSVNFHILKHTGFRFDILCQKEPWRRPSNVKMLTSLKNITETQKCDFSVNFHILIEHTGFRFDILCQKVDITPHCVFALNIALKKTFQR